jgi:transposase
MELITILNHCYHFRGFVYQHARFGPDKKTIEVAVRPREGASAVCSGCQKPAPGYDHLPERRFEFIPFWGFLVYFLYRMRRVHCRNCGVVVEEVPWGDGKHQLTRAYMLFLARWARKLSWRPGGLDHRTLAPIRAIGVDEGLNNKAKLTMRKSYGFRTFHILELALYHSLGKLPEPELTHEFF